MMISSWNLVASLDLPVHFLVLLVLTIVIGSHDFGHGRFCLGETSFAFANLSYDMIDCRDDAFVKGGDLTLVRTTSQNSYGWGLYKNPVQFLNTSNTKAMVSFQTSFSFSIQPKGDSPPFADGMAFIIVRTNQGPPSNSYGEFLGLYTPDKNASSRNHFFAVEFDTYQNFDLQDPSDSHIGININSMVSNTTYDTSANSSALNLHSNRTFTAWIDYDSTSQTTEVRMANGSVAVRPDNALFSLQSDLSGVLQPFMYVGFSGSTGLRFELQTVHTWSFTSGDKFYAALSEQKHHRCRDSNLCMGLVAVAVGVSMLAVCILLLGGWWLYRRTKRLHFGPPLNGGPQRYTYKELSRATKGFGAKQILGRGGFGCVYKGRLPPDGHVVAVKKITDASADGAERGFMSEISIISRLRHRNLVHLQGWCHEGENLLLVYEYMPNGSLEQLLHGENPQLCFTWELRYKAVVGVTAALAYLHEGWEQRVLHRDVKSSNVMLDARLEARLGDFGLARIMEHTRRARTLTIAGTLGYMAPEAAQTGRGTDKSDVYSLRCPRPGPSSTLPPPPLPPPSLLHPLRSPPYSCLRMLSLARCWATSLALCPPTAPLPSAASPARSCLPKTGVARAANLPR